MSDRLQPSEAPSPQPSGAWSPQQAVWAALGRHRKHLFGLCLFAAVAAHALGALCLVCIPPMPSPGARAAPRRLPLRLQRAAPLRSTPVAPAPSGAPAPVRAAAPTRRPGESALARRGSVAVPPQAPHGAESARDLGEAMPSRGDSQALTRASPPAHPSRPSAVRPRGGALAALSKTSTAPSAAAAAAADIVDLSDALMPLGATQAGRDGLANRAGSDPASTDLAGAPAANGVVQPARVDLAAFHCAWPPLAPHALAASVDLNAVIEADGTVSQVRIIRAPTRAFAQAARSCTRQTRFEPARDRLGRAVRSTSPLLRLRYAPGF